MPMVSKSKETPVMLTEQHITLRKIVDDLPVMLLHLIRMEIEKIFRPRWESTYWWPSYWTIFHSTFTLMVFASKMPLSS